MSAHLTTHPEVAAAARTACRIGFPVALSLAGLAAIAFLLGIATPPHSGPLCVGDCTLYPYADAGRFFPRDYLWMAPAVLLTPLFTVVAACVYLRRFERSHTICRFGMNKR